MKTRILVYATILGLAISLTSHAKSRVGDVEVSIDFGSPSRYTDIEIEGFSGEREQRIVKDLIRGEIERQASLYLPSGYALEVHVEDIDLAGYHEPLYPEYDRIRIMRATYPPRFEFRFAVKDDDRILVEEGARSLTDLNYLWRLDLPSRKQEIAYYVRSLLKDWARAELPAAVE